MTRSFRRRVFYTLVALFLVVGSGVVLYAEGWRFDFVTWRFERVGAIFIHSYPADASITLDGQPAQNQSGFLSGGTLVSNLLPRTHSVTLKYPGYLDWHENARVLPSFVTQFRYAVLVPQNAVPASSTAFPRGNPAPSPINPFDPTEKFVPGRNKISIVDLTQATTTLAVKVVGRNLMAAWIAPSVIGALQNDGSLYLFDTNTGVLRKLASDVKNFAAADDGSAIAALEHSSLEIFSLTVDNNYYRFNIQDVSSASRLLWYKDANHLFMVYPDHVSFLDLMDSNLTNFVTVAHGTKPYYDSQANALFIIGNNWKPVRYNFSS